MQHKRAAAERSKSCQAPRVGIYENAVMFVMHTLPWFWKALILAYDFARCWQQQDGEARFRDVYATTVHVFLGQLFFAAVLLVPSVLLSVQNRHNTSLFVSEMLLLLSTYMLLIRAIRTDALSPSSVCFCLQFCSCYFFFCFFSATTRHRTLLVGRSLVRSASVVGMCVFPVMFSHLPVDCMHLSPHVLLFLFAGEVSACACSLVSMALGSVESLINAAYVRCVL